jgi:hypothetical protein
MSNAGIPRGDRLSKMQARYYMVHGCHYDGDLVHSEFTDLGMSIYTTPGKIPPKRIPYDHKFQCS